MKTRDEITSRHAEPSPWRPRVRLIYCQCAGGGAGIDADLADNVRAEIVPCTGKIDSRRLLKAFESGADAVCIIGCAPDECKMVEGSRRAARRGE
jgi:hypothetical protein